MRFKIKYGGLISELVKRDEEDYEGNEDSMNVAQLIVNLFNKYFDLANFFENNPLKIFEHSMIFVNSKVVNPNEMPNVSVNEGDLIMFMPVVTGG